MMRLVLLLVLALDDRESWCLSDVTRKPKMETRTGRDMHGTRRDTRNQASASHSTALSVPSPLAPPLSALTAELEHPDGRTMQN